jgi:hypothetical protein
MSVCSYLLSRSPEALIVCPALAPTWMVFMGTSSLPEGCTRGVVSEPRWRELGGAESWPPGSSVASRATTGAWSFSSAWAPASRSPPPPGS